MYLLMAFIQFPSLWAAPTPASGNRKSDLLFLSLFVCFLSIIHLHCVSPYYTTIFFYVFQKDHHVKSSYDITKDITWLTIFPKLYTSHQ